jgi:hypothetical protein
MGPPIFFLSLAALMVSAAEPATVGSGAAAVAVSEVPAIIWTFDRRLHSGPSQKGLACLPSGRFALGDMAVPEDAVLREALGGGVTAEISAMEASLCSAYMGMGKGPSSRITLEVQWHVDGQPCGATVSSKIRVRNADLRFNQTVFLQALQGSREAWRGQANLPARCRISAN